MAEIALALEYPNKIFHLTDHLGSSHSLIQAKRLVRKFSIKNTSFGKFNILDELVKPIQKYDIVYSIEVLEHIEDDVRAAKNMNKISNKYIFCLVPYAEMEINNDQNQRKSAWQKHEHYVVGYDKETLLNYFPNNLATHGCYWLDSGMKFRQNLTAQSNTEIERNFASLLKESELDLQNKSPNSRGEALEIWILSQVR